MIASWISTPRPDKPAVTAYAISQLTLIEDRIHVATQIEGKFGGTEAKSKM